MTKGIPYPPRKSTIVFMEPYPRREWNGHSMTYYIKASINDNLEQEIRISAKQQGEIMEHLIRVDRKLTGAIVKSDSNGRWIVLRHSPQSDFFDLVKEESK